MGELAISMPPGENAQGPEDIKPALLVCLKRLAALQRSRIEAINLQEAVSQKKTASLSVKAMRGEFRHMSRRLGTSKPNWIKQPDPANVPLLMLDENLGCSVLRGQNASGQWVVEVWDAATRRLIEQATDSVDASSLVQLKLDLPFNSSASPVYTLIKTEIFAHKKVLFEVIIAGVVVNTVALATAFYSMQVYDRVIPSGALNTLLVLSIGAGVAVLYDLLTKHARHKLYNRLIDVVDQRLARSIFMRFLAVRLDQMPSSVGSLAAQMRGYESVRSFLTSVTSHVCVDAPFSLLYVTIIFFIAGKLALVPLAFFIVCVFVGLASHRRVEALANNVDKAVNLKTGLLVEVVEGAESIKSGQGGWRMLSRWMQTTDDARGHELKMRDVSEQSKNVVGSLQQASFLTMIGPGAVLASQGQMTMGALLACSILSGRTLAPVAAIPSLLVAWAQAKAALRGLDAIWALEDDHHGQSRPIALENLHGNYRFEEVAYSYGDHQALSVNSLAIQAGEKVAILGPVGSGKTTLLRLLSGMYKPQEGRIFLDDVDLAHISKPVLAEQIGFLQQEGRMFSGTLRENLTLGLMDPGDEALLEAAKKTGLLESVINSHSQGLEQPIFEGGIGLSGGQRQLVNLTRVFLRAPKIMLLDEPTASLDRALEVGVREALDDLLRPESTLILVTHKPDMLALVDRIIVVAGQKIAMDGPKEQVLSKLSAKRPTSSETAVQDKALKVETSAQG